MRGRTTPRRHGFIEVHEHDLVVVGDPRGARPHGAVDGAMRAVLDRTPRSADECCGICGHAVKSHIAAAIVGEQFLAGGEARPLPPSLARPVQLLGARCDSAPVLGVRRVATWNERVHHGAVDVQPPVRSGQRWRDPEIRGVQALPQV
jgi:hypothetical protein